MTALLLVDFDEIVGRFRQHVAARTELPMPRVNGRIDGFIDIDDGSGAPACGIEQPEAIVAIALSASTCNDTRLSLEFLRRFAVRLAGLARIGAPPPASRVVCEVAVVLSMPRLTAWALERLFRHAASAVGKRTIRELWLFSGDAALASMLAAELAPRTDSPWSWRRIRAGVQAWVTRGKGYTRPAPPPAALAPAWTRNQNRVDLPEGADICQLAREVERAGASVRPGLLSQLGLTTATTRGVGRLAWLPSGRPLEIGVCSPYDGVVVYHAPTPSSVPLPRDSESPRKALVRAKISEASVGPGAVTLRYGERGTTIARTRLPLAVLEDLTQASARVHGLVHMALRGRELDDATILAAARPAQPMGVPFRICLKSDGRGHASADVVGLPPPAWWLDRRGLATSCRPLPLRLRMCARTFTVDARLCRAPTGEGVAARALFEQVTVDVPDPIRERTIGAAVAGLSDVALLALDRPILRGSRPECQPIQDLGLAELQRRGPFDAAACHELILLPLLVPT
jgi:hypothetical protein